MRPVPESLPAEHGYSHACTACGKCCNSSPTLTLAELFHHRHRFIGALAISRRRRVAAGEALASAIWHEESAQSWIALAVVGLDYPSLARCPALRDDGLCDVHHDLKPAICAAVPLDPLAPDALQQHVVPERMRDSVYVGANCLRQVPAAEANYVRAHRIVDATAADAVTRMRNGLIEDKQRWGNAVFAAMAPTLRTTRIPDGGYLTIPLVPVLTELARHSAEAAQQCTSVAEAQLVLITDTIAQAIARKQAADRPFTEQLWRFQATYTLYRTSQQTPKCIQLI